MSVSLYRKYRSRSLDEIVGQKGVVKALNAAIKNDSLSHAYLFTGPRGVGKTSIARILAYAINDLPYTKDELPVDIIEIDAASNRGIEEIRELKERVKIAPVNAKYKVYIIDEVHMLTTPAFNALLKTLEEPPAHVIFILATTEGHKLPETIISRTQRYNFSLATSQEVIDHLKKICALENIIINDEALELIAVHSGGSLRDALSTLDHVRHLSKDIKAEDVRTNIGLPSQDIIDQIIKSVYANDAKTILELIKSSEQNNISPTAIASGLIESLKTNIQSEQNQLTLHQTIALLKNLSEVESSSKPNVMLVVGLLNVLNTTQLPAKPTTQAKPSISTVTVKSTNKTTVDVKKPNILESSIKSQPINTPEKEFSLEVWQNVLEDIRSSHNTLYSVLRVAEVDLSDIPNQKLILKFEFPFHKKRISEKKNKQFIEDKLTTQGYNLQISCEIVQKKFNETVENTVKETTPENELLTKISRVFGGAEAME